jgi:hypothetical protein
MKTAKHIPVLMIDTYLWPGLYTRATKGSMKSGKVQACLIPSIAQGFNIYQLFSMSRCLMLSIPVRKQLIHVSKECDTSMVECALI